MNASVESQVERPFYMSGRWWHVSAIIVAAYASINVRPAIAEEITAITGIVGVLVTGVAYSKMLQTRKLSEVTKAEIEKEASVT